VGAVRGVGGSHGEKSLWSSGAAYDGFMGRYSRVLAGLFADVAEVARGQQALDVGCGTGALTGELVRRLGAGAVTACDPSAPFVEECRARHPGVDVRTGGAEALPFGDGVADRVLAQLVLHFVGDPRVAAAEFRRVLRPGGVVAACVWDFDEGMQMLRAFWDAALAQDAEAPDEARTMRFGRPGEIAQLFADHGFEDVVESTLKVSCTYGDFDELWAGFLAGVGPAGGYCVSRTDDERTRIRDELLVRLGAPAGPFALTAAARCARATVPLGGGPATVSRPGSTRR